MYSHDKLRKVLPEENEGRKTESPMIAAMWKDETSYSQGDKERIPRTWTARAGGLILTISRHVHLPPDAWVGYCRQLGIEQQLRGTTKREAQKELIFIVEQRLRELLRSLKAFH